MRHSLNLGTRISLTVSLILVVILACAAWAFIYYEYSFFERNIRDKANRTLTILAAAHTQAMLHRSDVRDHNPVIETLNGTFEQLSEASPDMTLWLVMGPKVFAYQRENERLEREPPRDDVDLEALDSGETVARVTRPGIFRLTRPVVLGRGSARFPGCFNCHGEAMGIADGEVIGAYSVQLSITGEQEKLNTTRNAVILISLFASLGIALVSSFLLSRLAIKPLENMTRTMSDLARGDLSIDVPFRRRPDEIGQMARSLEVFKETAIARRHAEEDLRLREAELARVLRRSTLGEMASALAHELGQPLGAIASYCGGLSNRLESGEIPKDELRDILLKISDMTHRASSINRTIADHVRGVQPQRSVCDIGEVIDAITPLIEADTRAASVELELVNLTGPCPVNMNRTEIESVVINLVRNALEALGTMPAQDRHLSIRVDATGHEVTIAVTDSGPGFSGADTERLFEPFYTTKHDGIGMGLAISRTIVQDHGGRLYIDAGSAQGARVCFTLPVAGVAGNET